MSKQNSDSNERCFACRKPMRKVPMIHGNGNISYSYDCIDPKCVYGTSGLFTIRYLQKDTGKVTSVTKFFSNKSFMHEVVGNPSKNESNVRGIAKAFMDAVNRQYKTQYDEYRNEPESSLDERGYDCEIHSTQKKYSLRIQVTRALPSEIYQEQYKQQKRQIAPTTHEACHWIMKAIRKKTSRASPDIALVIDGIDAPFTAIATDLEVLFKNQDELNMQKWHSIWIIGPAGARQLAGSTLP